MKNKRSFRTGFGMGQIMAMLLVVLPMIAFVLTLMTEYWSIMQTDYRLKVIANKVSTFADSRKDLRDFSDGSGGTAQDFQNLVDAVNTLCPKGTTITFGTISDAPKGEVSVTIQYVHNGPYFKNKTLSTTMSTYSYHDQNMSVTGTCQ